MNDINIENSVTGIEYGITPQNQILKQAVLYQALEDLYSFIGSARYYQNFILILRNSEKMSRLVDIIVTENQKIVICVRSDCSNKTFYELLIEYLEKMKDRIMNN